MSEITWQGSPQCEHCGIRHILLFAHLSYDDFSLIHKSIDDLLFAACGAFYEAGGPSDHIYTVHEG